MDLRRIVPTRRRQLNLCRRLLRLQFLLSLRFNLGHRWSESRLVENFLTLSSLTAIVLTP